MPMSGVVSARSAAGFAFLLMAALLMAATMVGGMSARAEDCAALRNDSERLACFDRAVTPDGRFAKAENAVRANLKDPDSAKFSDLSALTSPNVRGEPTKVVCGRVNARNSYGGYAGAAPFVYFVDEDKAYIAGGNPAGAGMMAELAGAMYRRFCLGQQEP
jgi:hypothetical protein